MTTSGRSEAAGRKHRPPASRPAAAAAPVVGAITRSRLALASVLAVLAAVTVLAAPAGAARPASPAEAAAIEAVGLKACGSAPAPCRFDGAKVSTRNPRYAWGEVIGEGFSGVLVKRRNARSHRFRVVGTQGGGIAECSYWRARAPRRVLRDLRIAGLVDASGRTRNCGA